MKRFLKLLMAFTLFFSIAFINVKAQEDPLPPVAMVETAPVVSIKGNNDSLILSWEAVENANSYVIERSTKETSGFKKIATITDTSYKDKKLSYGTKYYYKVTAKGTNNSMKSSVVGKKVAPNKVTNVTLKPYSTKVKLTWDKVSTTGYYVYRSTDGKKFTKVATITKNSTLTYTNTKLKSNYTYYYQVQAYKKVGSKTYTGSKSDIVSVKTAPAAPSLKISSPYLDELLLKVKTVKGASYYDLEYYNESTKTFEDYITIYPEYFEGGEFQAHFYAEKPYHNYQFRVRACSDLVCGSWTTVKAQAKLGKTTIEVLKAGKTDATLIYDYIWGSDGYEIYRSTSKNGTYKKVKTLKGSATTEYKDTKLTKGKTYYYKVRSFIKIGKKTYYSSFSAIRSVKIGSIVDSACADAKSLNKLYYPSKAMLLEYLVSIGYKESDAKSGISKAKIDFKANALKQAKEFINLGATAEDGVRYALQEAGFTESEIEYVLSKVNVDWHQTLVDAITNDILDGHSLAEFIKHYTDPYYGFTEEEIIGVLEDLNVDFDEQALMVLEDYLYWSDGHISKSIAREYLEYHEFTTSEIEYALDNVEYDFTQAIIDDYNEMVYNGETTNYYSKAMVIQILTGSVYGHDEADVNEALNSLGINFNYIAVCAANSLLDGAYWTPGDLKDTLVGFLFTESEAEYAINNVDFSASALDYAESYIGAGAHSMADIIAYLEERGFSETLAASTAANSEFDYNEECVEYVNLYYIGTTITKTLDEIRAEIKTHGFTDENIDYAFEETNLESYL